MPTTILVMGLLLAAPVAKKAQPASPPPTAEVAPDAATVAQAADLRKKGIGHMRAGDNIKALPLLKQAVKLDPASPDNLRALAGCLSRLNHFDEAAEYYRKFLVLAPNDPAAGSIRKALENYQQSR